ncbi:hypothetical protein [Nocardia sp. NPDC051570]|uniref:hypothetical protein n=1 Tax=Nocardia sp. NPDC051570 TaxID=3364324 RepID=UPI0037AD37D6
MGSSVFLATVAASGTVLLIVVVARLLPASSDRVVRRRAQRSVEEIRHRLERERAVSRPEEYPEDRDPDGE